MEYLFRNQSACFLQVLFSNNCPAIPSTHISHSTQPESEPHTVRASDTEKQREAATNSHTEAARLAEKTERSDKTLEVWIVLHLSVQAIAQFSELKLHDFFVTQAGGFAVQCVLLNFELET